MTRLMNPSDQVVSSWTGFNIITRSYLKVEDDVVGYLPTINAPATDMSTVQEILRSAKHLESMVDPAENIAKPHTTLCYGTHPEDSWKKFYI